MAGQKTLTPQERATAAPLVQGAMQTFQQHYGMTLTTQETSRVVEKALDNMKSASTTEAKGAVRDQMFALLIEKDPGRAIDLRMQFQNVAETERGRIHGIAEEKGFRAANMEIAKLSSEQKPKKEAPAEKAPKVAAAPEQKAKAPTKKQEVETGAAPLVKRQEPVKSQGLTPEELLKKAENANYGMRAKAEEYLAKKEEIETRYNEKYGLGQVKMGTSSYNDATERKNKDPAYIAEASKLEKTYGQEIDRLKKTRDGFIKEVLRYRGREDMIPGVTRLLNYTEYSGLSVDHERSLNVHEALQNTYTVENYVLRKDEKRA